MNDLSLTKDPATLYRLLQEQIEQNKFLRQQNAELLEQLQLIQHQLSKLQGMLFGQKSERKKPKLGNGNNSGTNQNTKNNQNTNGNNNKNGRRALPKSLEREKIIHDLPEDKKFCSCCQVRLQCIGKDVTEQLDFVPARLIAKSHIRYKYACKYCSGNIVTAPMPEQPIDKGLAGSGLLAEILINKYQDSLPLYRQQQRWLRLGYDLPRSTLCDWVSQSAERLKPIVDAMITSCLLPAKKIHTDDTIVPVQAKGKTHNGRLWVYVGNTANAPPCTIYQYSRTRAQTVLQKFFKNYRGYLQADAYPGYDKLFNENKIIEVGCWAHTRRKFTDVIKSAKEPTLANQAIDLISQLYKIEKHCKNMPPTQRYFYRRRFAKPILKKIYRWLKYNQPSAPPKSPLGSAINYALNHWQAFNNYLRDGILDIDNNQAERAIRPLVIGRKNYLFAGSDKGAENAAVIYSLIESCKMLDINPFNYLKDVLKRLPTTLSKDIAELFPCYWKPGA